MSPAAVYLRSLFALAARPSWSNLNGIGGALFSAVAAAIWPLDLAAPGWLNLSVTFVIYAVIAFAVLFAGQVLLLSPYRLWKRDRRDPSPPAPSGLEIVFDVNDSRFVKDKITHLNTVDNRRWYVGVKNLSTTRNVDDVSLRAQEGRFVRHTISVAHELSARDRRVPVILERPTISPCAIEYVELFGLGGNVAIAPVGDLFAQRQTFVLEVRGRDTPTVMVEFEYLPTVPPTIRRVS